MRILGTSLILAVFMGLTGCAHSPDWDRQMGEKASHEMVAYVGVSDDAKLTAYLNDTGQRIVQQIPNRQFDFRFRILDQPVANAFSLPGGYVYVTRGLLALTNSQDELASVLGHEAAHVTLRHAAQRSEAATVPGILSLPGAVVGAVAPIAGDLLAAPARGVGAVYLAGYSRDQEREADRLGQELAARAGFDPHAMPEFLDRLGHAEDLNTDPNERRIPNFLQTHPQTPERVTAAEQRATQLAQSVPPSPASARDEYLRTLDGLILGDDPAVGIFVGEKFLHPTLGFALVAPRGWKYANLPVAVAVLSPNQDAGFLLDRPSESLTPAQAADQFIAELRKQGINASAQPLTIHDLPAERISLSRRVDKSVSHLDVTWIAHEGKTYRIVSVADSKDFDTIRAAVESFHDITAAERATIQVRRLRLADAHAGETIADLSKRTQNQWDAKTTALMNGIDASASLRAGQRIKVSQSEAYTSP